MAGIFDGILSAITSPVAQLGSTLLGGLFASHGQEEANEMNREIAESNNAFNAEQAALNRDFQSTQLERVQQYNTEMSNTSWQRAVRDMQSAGLNPMLAYMKGGASSPTVSAPGGSTASSSGNPVMLNTAEAGLRGAYQAAQTGTERERAPLVQNQAAVEKEAATQAQWVTSNFERILRSRILQGEENVKLTTEEIGRAVATIANLAKEGQLIDARAALVRIQTRLAELEVPHGKAIAEYFTTEWGKHSPYFLDVMKLFNSAGRARRDFSY